MKLKSLLAIGYYSQCGIPSSAGGTGWAYDATSFSMGNQPWVVTQ